MQEYSVDSSVNPITQPSQPHFDDERTLQTARPVVPLEKIKVKARHRRRWVLGGAFAVAMMLGAASALLASYLKLRHTPPTVATQVSEEAGEVDAAPAQVAAAQPAATPEISTPEVQPGASSEGEDAALAEPARKEPAVKHRTVERHAAHPVMEPEAPQLNEDQELHRIREAVLYDQWEERRARRVLRERRRNERYNHRDLSNLDEIFEGRKRP
jgi:hypothetical protein